MFLASEPSPESVQQFFHNILRDWVSSLQDFLHHDLPKLIVVLAFAWVLIWMVNLLTRRMSRIAATRTSDGIARTSQIKTVASVLNAPTDRSHRTLLSDRLRFVFAGAPLAGVLTIRACS